jgi:uncharacterized protein YkwD
MIKTKYLFSIALVVLVAVSNIVVARNSADAYLSPVEQEVLDELNLARTNPKRYAEFLSEMRPYFNGNRLERPGEVILVTQEGVAAVDEAIKFLRSTQPVSALRSSRGMSLAAKAHVRDQQDGAMGHTGSDGSQPWDRMNRYGTWDNKVAENISYGGNTARGVVIQLIVDDGVPSRGHRVNMLNPAYRFVGIGCGAHARFNDTCTLDFATRFIEKSRH